MATSASSGAGKQRKEKCRTHKSPNSTPGWWVTPGSCAEHALAPSCAIEKRKHKEVNKMRQHVPKVLLWLFVINLGIALGAGLYEQRVVIPQWENIPPQEWPNTGVLFWAYVTTVPLTLLTLANLVAAWLDRGTRRYWWLAAVAIIVVERIATFSYFIPTMVWLQGTEGLPEAKVQAALSQWLVLDYGRHVLTLAGWLAALKAFSLPAGKRGG